MQPSEIRPHFRQILVLKIFPVAVSVLDLDKEPAEDDDEDEYDPMDPATKITEVATTSYSHGVAPLKGT
jgi:hypothetical protein